MICVLAMIVLGILSIFSAKYRSGAKEAFECVFKRITLRKCDTGFDQKMKAKITGKLMKKHPKVAKFTFKHFEVISWIFVIIFFVSLIYTSYGLYNLAVYKSCTPDNPEGCIFNIEQIEPECSEQVHCDPCECGEQELNCTAPDYEACAGECDCTKVCEEGS